MERWRKVLASAKEAWRKLVAGAVGIGFLAFWLADWLDKAKSVVEAPDTAAKLWSLVRSMFSFTPEATVVLLLGIAALVVALWRPSYTEFIRSLLSSAGAARAVPA